MSDELNETKRERDSIEDGMGVSEELVSRLRCARALDDDCQEAADLIDRLIRERDANAANVDKTADLLEQAWRERDEAITERDSLIDINRRHGENALLTLDRLTDLERERDDARAELKEACDDLQRLNDDAVRYCRERDDARRALEAHRAKLQSEEMVETVTTAMHNALNAYLFAMPRAEMCARAALRAISKGEG